MALITGAASGQGRAAALLFAAHGASIAVVDIDDEGAAETASPRRGRRGGGRRRSTPTSRVRADVEAMVAATVERVRSPRRPLQQRRGADVRPARRVHRGRLGPDDRHQPRRHLLGVPGRAARDGRTGAGARSSTPRRCSASSAPRATWPTARPRPGSCPHPPDRRRVRTAGAGQRDRAGLHRHASLPQGRRRDGRSRGRSSPGWRRPSRCTGWARPTTWPASRCSSRRTCRPT